MTPGGGAPAIAAFGRLVGAAVVLALPSRAGATIKGVSLGITLVTFALTLVAFGIYVADGSRAARPLAERASTNALVSAGIGGDALSRPETEDRVVVEGIQAVRAVVDDLVALLLEPGGHAGLGVERCVIGSQMHPHDRNPLRSLQG